MLELDGVKMSKSLGNLVLARDCSSDFEPDHLRLYLLSNHLRVDVNYRDGDMPALLDRYSRLKAAYSVGQSEGEPNENGHPRLAQAFKLTMDTDFNVPGAIDILDTTARRILDGTADPGEAPELRRSLAILGFAFAGARGPANGDLEP